MISSISLRSFPKTCGLFDTGFAGDDQQITSIEPIAPADVLSEFDLGGQYSSISLIDPSHLDSDDVAGSLIKGSQLQSNPTLDEDNWDLLDDLSADPLGDDSLDAFINLDKYLIGNSFFDEDGNLVKDIEEVNPVISIPTIQECDQNASELMPKSVATMVQNTEEMVSCSSASVDVTAHVELTVTGKQTPCKRKRKAKSGSVKTSLFEILDSTADNQLDHDYSSKRLKLSVKTGSTTNSYNSCDNIEAPLVTVIDSVNMCEANPSTSMEPPLDKQSLRRLKNNVASKRSREQRKQKFVDMDKEAEELVIKNDKLRKKIVELEELAAEMKKVLVSKMAGK